MRKEKMLMAVLIVTISFCVSLFLSSPASAASSVRGAPAEIKIAIVQYLSGPAVKSGTAMANVGRLAVDQINREGGIHGVKVRLILVDEAGTVDKQVTEFRRLVMDEKVDAVLGYLSSANTLAVARVADELKTLTIFGAGGTSRLFEERDYKFVFRAANCEGSDNVASAVYTLALNPNIKTIAGINQDYAWGRDSWETFKRVMLKLKPDIKVVEELWPKLGTVEFSTEISKLQSSKPDVIHTSFWSGFLDSFIKQAVPRGLFKESMLVLPIAGSSFLSAGKDIPAGVVVGDRAGNIPYVWPDYKNAAAKKFYDAYEKRYGEFVFGAAFLTLQDIMALKAGYEKAIKKHGHWPTREELAKAMEYLEFDTMGVRISMALGKGHQAIHPQVYGVTGKKRHPKWGYPLLEKTRVFAGEKVNAPANIKHLDWIKGWPAGKSF